MRALGASRTSLVPGGVLAGPWVRDPLWRRARAVPSLDLRFADNKSLVDAVTGASLVTFTRASSGTFVDSAGVIQTAATDVPRFGHNPTTGESLGLLVEEQGTNLLLRSEEFDNASWTLLNLSAFGSGSVANATTAPDGATTADKVVEDTTPTNTHRIRQLVGVTSGTTYTFSVFAKAAERTEVSLQMTVGFASTTVAVNLLNGNVTGTTGSPIATSVTPYQNGWYRISVTQTANLTTAVAQFVIFLVSPTGGTYTGDGTSGLFLWGAQLEAGASPISSYIPTTTAAVTRSADVASITGSAFSSWHQSGVGSLYGEAISRSSGQVDAGGTAIGVAVLSDGTNDNRIRFGATGTQAIWIAATNTEALLTSGTYTAGASFKLAAAYAVNDFAFTKDAATVQVDTSGVVPTVSQLNIGRSNVAAGLLTGTIRRLCYWPQRLSNASLQSITQ